MSEKNNRNDGFFLSENSSKTRLRDAQTARNSRAEILKAYSHGKVSRRDLVKWGLITAGGALAPIGGLNPFVPSARGQVARVNPFADAGGGIPTGMQPSPTFGVQPFSTPMPRFDVLQRHPNPFTFSPPPPTAQANQTQQPVDPKLGGGFGPIEGRPPVPIWAHQKFTQLPPQIAVEASQAQATTNTVYNPQVPSNLNSGINPATPIPLKFHPGFPTQNANSVWTFNGTIPPKLVIGKYGEPILFRHHNRLPVDVTQNNGFGRHTISTHEHNGHHGAENDGFTGAFFFPNEFYDYHWPIVLAGRDTINTSATYPPAWSPHRSGRNTNVPGHSGGTHRTHLVHDRLVSLPFHDDLPSNAANCDIYNP